MKRRSSFPGTVRVSCACKGYGWTGKNYCTRNFQQRGLNWDCSWGLCQAFSLTQAEVMVV